MCRQFYKISRIRLSLLGVLELLNFLVSTEKYPCNTLQKRQNFVLDSSMSSFYGQVCVKLVSRRENMLELVSWLKLLLPPTPAPLPPPNTHTPQHTPRYLILFFFLIVMSVYVIITEMFSLHTKTQGQIFFNQSGLRRVHEKLSYRSGLCNKLLLWEYTVLKLLVPCPHLASKVGMV